MSYTALYRKFRPDTFSDVKGQDHIVTTLKNQIKANRIGHAYIFTGTRGTGKTTVAKILAKAVNCENPNEDGPCGECDTCRAIASGASMNVIEMDAASNRGIDDIREIVSEVSYSPAAGKYKVYIIDEAHMLTPEACNALLKTIEEPPSYVIFILATTEVNKLPITIRSRCQRYDFRRISIDTIAARMKELMTAEDIDVEDRALRYIAKAADGSLRDGLSLLDQCIAFNLGETLTYDKALEVLGAVDAEVFGRLLDAALKRNVKKCITILEEVVMQGRELTQFVADFTWYLRNLMLVKSSDNLEDVIDMSAENMAVLKDFSEKADMVTVIRFIRIFSELSGRMRYATQKRILLEMELIKLCKPEMEIDTDSIMDRIRVLEDKIENGVVISGVSQDGAESGAGAQSLARRKRAEMPKSVPEDIKTVISRWSAIIENFENPAKGYLKSHSKPSLTGDGKLLLVFNNSEFGKYFTDNNENFDNLQYIISEQAGKEIELEIKSVDDENEYVDSYPDLTKFIKMEIEEEDE
ncbi:MAG: DNA polymerase III subunit gamma/tau [Lachnospiraceae bacterium]|nr:DNA polymerase III subunit gamma/tau [Lachnospiraceae bacterium]